MTKTIIEGAVCPACRWDECVGVRWDDSGNLTHIECGNGHCEFIAPYWEFMA